MVVDLSFGLLSDKAMSMVLKLGSLRDQVQGRLRALFIPKRSFRFERFEVCYSRFHFHTNFRLYVQFIILARYAKYSRGACH